MSRAVDTTRAVIRPWERALYKGCRRAWDLSARDRQNWEPVVPAPDFGRAVRDALAVYYFPGMWDWNRAIVRPLATEAFLKSMRQQREVLGQAGFPPDADDAWEARTDAGQRMLEAYYQWAAEVDRFSSVQVESLFDVTVPDPADPLSGLLTPEGRGIDYRVRIDLVVVDEHERYWLVDHRVISGDWPELDHLLLDEQILSRSWAWELGFLARVSGTIHNELRLPGPHEPEARGRAPGEPPALAVIDRGDRLIRQEIDGMDPSRARFRRTEIPRDRPEIDNAGIQVAVELREMTRPGVALYPSPAPDRCAPCAYRRPCIAISQGDDPAGPLSEDYRKRTTPDFEEGRLGSVWGFVPHRPDQTHTRLTPPPPPPGDG